MFFKSKPKYIIPYSVFHFLPDIITFDIANIHDNSWSNLYIIEFLENFVGFINNKLMVSWVFLGHAEQNSIPNEKYPRIRNHLSNEFIKQLPNFSISRSSDCIGTSIIL